MSDFPYEDYTVIDFDNSKSKFVPREMYEEAYRAWKQVAKKWWHKWQDMWADWLRAENKASRRLELLRRLEWMELYAGLEQCPICSGYEPGQNLNEWTQMGHADDCELARELKDE